jgi:molybdate transport system ATP-binding protein
MAGTGDLLQIEIRHRLRRIELDVRFAVGRETLALVGPSGAGKTSVLRAVAGLYKPDHARIVLAGRTLVDTERHVNLPPESRRVGMMFQDGALFPHLTIARNVEYGLRPRPHRRRERRARIDDLLARYGIAELRDARPGKASGGERQRAALARAVATTPDILLLDEPLTALDSVTKARVSRELAQWLTELGLPTILVSHDYADVAGLADRIAVIDAGSIVQTGTAADLQRTPASPFVAAFVATNYFRGTAHRDGDLTVVTLPQGTRFVCTAPAGGDVALVVDPWAVRLTRAAGDPTATDTVVEPTGAAGATAVSTSVAAAAAALNVVRGPVAQLVRTGGVVRVTMSSDPPLVAELPAGQADALGLARGELVAATWPPEAGRLVSCADGAPRPTDTP